MILICFFGHILLGGAVVKILQEFLGKGRTCVPLKEIIEKIACKICFIRNNNYTF